MPNLPTFSSQGEIILSDLKIYIYIYIIIPLYILLYIESHCFHSDFFVYNASVRFMNDALFHVTINTLTQILKIDLIRVSGWIDTSKRQMRPP